MKHRHGFRGGVASIAAVILAAAFFSLPAGCSTTSAPPATADAYRATPEADTPAAGICASFKEITILVEIRAWPDGIPDPRCIAVRAEQVMVLLNSSPEAIEFTLGRYRETIGPGSSFAVELAFGDYLLPGVHSLHIQPYGGPELYFEPIGSAVTGSGRDA